jgi:BirA family biotin operon repressor/biotin-[acetyl-CoA-carboxylase] ligase
MISRPKTQFIKNVISGLNTKIIGKNVYHFETIDSTNLYAKKLVKEGVENGSVVISDIQLSGRGRKNRTWSSPKGGLWFSIILYPKISLKNGMLVTMASSVAIVQGIKDIIGITPVIKWPNDLLINDKKVCGILAEIEAEKDNIKYAIIGIGVNVNNQLEKKLYKTATTLKQEIGNQVSIVELFRLILKRFDENYNRLILGDYDFIRNSWLLYSDIIGKKIQVQDDKTLVIGRVTNIDDNGYLILDTENGPTRIVSGNLKYL